MPSTDLTLFALQTSATVSLALLVMLVCLSVGVGTAASPEPERSFRDFPPLGFRLVWWPIQTISVVLVRLPLGFRRDRLQGRLRRAGLEFSITATQFRAAQVFAALCAGVAGSWGLVWLLTVHAHSLAPSQGPQRTWLPLALLAMVVLLGWALPRTWMRSQERRRRVAIARSMPFFLDLISMCVEAGLNVQGAVAQAVSKGPQSEVREEFRRVLRDIRAGKTRVDALREMAQRLSDPSVTNFVACVVQADRMGMSLGPLLRMQAEQRLNERFIRAEKLAFQAPVKMLFPLAVFIFPCTFIILFFPIVIRLSGVAH